MNKQINPYTFAAVIDLTILEEIKNHIYKPLTTDSGSKDQAHISSPQLT